MTELRVRKDDEHLAVLLPALLSPASNCVDVGAHKGEFLIEFERLAPLGRHIAFEPLPHLAQELREKFPRCEIHEAAASVCHGESTFTWVKSHPAMSGLRRRTYWREVELEEIHVRLEALDEVLPADYVPHLIKIDVEGAEQQVLEGALSTLKRYQPFVIFEHGLGGADAYGTTSADIHRILCDQAGLRIFDLDGRGPFGLSEFEALLTNRSGTSWRVPD